MNVNGPNVENNQGSKEIVLTMQIWSTSGLHLYSTGQRFPWSHQESESAGISVRLVSCSCVSVVICLFQHWVYFTCSCFQFELKSRDSALSWLCRCRFCDFITKANDDKVMFFWRRPPVCDSVSYWGTKRTSKSVFKYFVVQVWIHDVLALPDVLSERVRLTNYIVLQPWSLNPCS